MDRVGLKGEAVVKQVPVETLVIENVPKLIVDALRRRAERFSCALDDEVIASLEKTVRADRLAEEERKSWDALLESVKQLPPGESDPNSLDSLPIRAGDSARMIREMRDGARW